MEVLQMGETQCGICNEKSVSRSMSLCPECMLVVCDHCFDVRRGRCLRCAARETD